MPCPDLSLSISITISRVESLFVFIWTCLLSYPWLSTASVGNKPVSMSGLSLSYQLYLSCRRGRGIHVHNRERQCVNMSDTACIIIAVQHS